MHRRHLAAAALLLSACQVEPPSTGLSHDAISPVSTPDPRVVGDPEWNADPDRRGFISPDHSDGYWDNFYICKVPDGFAGASCGQSTVISQGTTLTVSGNVTIPFGQGRPSISIGVSGSATASQRYEVQSGECETCWPEVCFIASVRRWRTQGRWVSPNPMGGRGGIGGSGRPFYVPGRTYYTTTLSSQRITTGTCRPDPLLCECDCDDAGVTDGGSGDAGTCEPTPAPSSGATEPSDLDDLQLDIDDEEQQPPPPSMTLSLESGSTFSSLDEGGRCAMVFSRDRQVGGLGGSLSAFGAARAGGGDYAALSPVDRYGCGSPSELRALFESTPGSDAGAADAGTDGGT